MRILIVWCVLLSTAVAKELVLGLRPLGIVDADLMQMIQADLQERMICKVIVLPVLAMPKVAYYAPRKRYRAEVLLDELDRQVCPEADKLVGITQVDISTTKDAIPDWGIFGLGSLGGRSCVVSTFRLGARGASAERRLERIRRVVRHEVLHTFGLGHCPEPGCVMEDAMGTITSVDRGNGMPCAVCRSKVPGLYR